ncbi:MAG: tRNA epoxyqueuosine(34) reductase QueG [Gammaproteobacteria bacterium]|nr:tRNA epoxyqueuosine(34) reductase QueG [Gammaproteobacteria bacterium]NNJ48867.1 tRNA epoxyqueuosine(34) reductase QueG [Gammaproteobacteria bacterium]
MPEIPEKIDYDQLLQKIETWSEQLGFQQLGVSDINLSEHDKHLKNWLDAGYHGEMGYMAKHGSKRSHPEQLVENTTRVISVRMDYMPPDCELSDAVLAKPEMGFISRYALGRDYHKVMRNRLQKLSDRIKANIGEFGYRVFVDSAPVLEKALAEKSGLGWIGKHSNLINQRAGSWFFLGEIYTDLPLPLSDHHTENHCGTCSACIDTCPTGAIVEPYTVDARRCISYLTIELHGSIPVEFRRDMGNRIYGCDDCQLCCPWNRFSQPTSEQDFFSRHPLDAPDLIELFCWDEGTFLKNTEGSAIRRIGHRRWLRNIAIALGNAPWSKKIIEILQEKKQQYSYDEMLAEHIEWALASQRAMKNEK